MDLFNQFLSKIDDEIKFHSVGGLVKGSLKISVSRFCKLHKINRGSFYHMINNKRPIPLRLLNALSIKPESNLVSVDNGNVPVLIPKTLSNDLAYLVGVLRDGTVSKETPDEYCCAFYNKHKEFIEVLQQKIEKLFGIKPKTCLFGEVYGVRIRSKTLYLFFKKVFDFPDKQKDWATPNIIKEASKEIIRNYIQGFWDAEGSCPHVENKKQIVRKNLYLGFSQKNKESLDFIKSYLEQNGVITRKIYWNQSKWVLKIRTQSIPSFSTLIGSQHPVKSKRLSLVKAIFSSK